MTEPTPPRTRAWYREPLLHFVLLGALVFGVSRLRSGDPAPPPPDAAPSTSAESERRIVIRAERLQAMRDDHRRRTGSPPTPAELDAMIETAVRGELLYHEALRLGLDREDPIVRRRLVQKMTFLLEDLAAPELTDAAIRAYYEAHAEDFQRSPTTTFEHVFLPENASTTDAEIEAALEAGADPASLGAPFLHGQRFVARSDAQIDAAFGAGFSRLLRALSEGDWSGPLRSTYGRHRVRVTERAPATTPPLDAIREQVTRAARDQARGDALEAELDALRARYTVHVEDSTP